MISPVSRFGHGAGALAWRDTVLSRERALAVPPGLAVEFDIPCLFPGCLPPVWPHCFQRFWGQSHDVEFGVARVSTDLSISSHSLGAVERSRRLFVLAPAAKRIVQRFGVTTLAQGDTAMATSLRLLMNVEASVPLAEVHEWLPYGATASRQPPFVSTRLRGTVLDDRRHFVQITAGAAPPVR